MTDGAARMVAISVGERTTGLADFTDFSGAAAIQGALNGIFWVDFNGYFEVARKVLAFWRTATGNLYYRGRRRVVAAACLTGSCFQLESAALIAQFAQSLLLTAQGLPLMSCRLLAGLDRTYLS
jgi:hypothetical protein